MLLLPENQQHGNVSPRDLLNANESAAGVGLEGEPCNPRLGTGAQCSLIYQPGETPSSGLADDPALRPERGGLPPAALGKQYALDQGISLSIHNGRSALLTNMLNNSGEMNLQPRRKRSVLHRMVTRC